jgi:signal transduction histidine kinase/ligand-binding sensor domain-containing protein/DNA-binding response OmpR family regulator
VYIRLIGGACFSLIPQKSLIYPRLLMRKLVTIIVVCLAGLSLFAQTNQYQFSRLDISQGLSHSQINTILRDSKGFMWFGTMSGLNRYDGYVFNIFRHNLHDSTTLGDDFIVRLFEGPGNMLWANTRSGLNIFNPFTEKVDRNGTAWLGKYALPAAAVNNIMQDSKGHYWFIMNQAGLYKFDTVTGKTTRVVIAGGNGAGGVWPAAIAEDKRGDIWVLLNDGTLKKIDSRTGAVLEEMGALADARKRELLNYSMYIDSDDELWIYVGSDTRGMYHYQTATKWLNRISKESGEYRLNNNLITGVVEDNKGDIWVCTDHGGVNVLNKKTHSSHYLMSNDDDLKSLSQNSTTTVYKDEAGIIWIGTYKKGISYYRERTVSFPLFTHQPSDAQSLPYNDVNRFVEDPWGNLWIGTNGGGLIYYDRSRKTYRQFLHDANDPNSISGNVIVSLFVDHAQRLWVGSYFGGLDCMEGKKFIHYRHSDQPNSLSDNSVWEIYEDSKRNLWVGTLNGGINLLDRQSGGFSHYRLAVPGTLSADYISDLVEDKEGRLWIGTANGVDVLQHREHQPDSFQQYLNIPGNPASLSNNNVISLLQDKQGRIWVGTRDGLNVFDAQKKTFQVFRAEDGLPDNTILTILEDEQGALWVSTPNGISQMRPQYDQHLGKLILQCHNYNELDGLQGRAFNENAALKTRKGELLFGGSNGFNLFHPAAIVPDSQLAPLVFTDLRIFNKSVGIGEKVNGRILLSQSIIRTNTITLKYDENVLSLEFAALNYSSAEKNKYAYKLEGFNDDWTMTDGRMRMVTYTNLDPGDYTFRVKAATSNDIWNKEELSLHIRVLPPFWKTPLAYILYVLLLAAILWISRQLIVQRARIRFQLEQQRKEAQRMHELDMMKIRFFTNVSHEFRTPLSLILTPMDKIIEQSEDAGQKKQFQLIHRNARRLLNLVNQLLDFRKMEVQELRLNAATGDIIKFIKEISWSFTDMADKKNIRFSFYTSIDSLVAGFDADKLERILFNLISNAFKFTPEQGSVTVVLDREEKEPGKPLLSIQVKDTGIGIPEDKQEKIFERFFQHDIPGSMVNQGSGIGLSITKEFVKLHGGTISVESEPEKGSCFTVWLPIQMAAAPVPEPMPESAEINTSSAEQAAEVMSSEAMVFDENDMHKKMLLLVEDNEDFRFYLKDNLRQYFTILEAADGKEGWQKALAHHPDLVVSDISMPEMDGIGLCRKIKKDQRTSHIPVILLTALAGEEQQLKGLEGGANDYLTKPFNFEILLSRIRNLLSQQAVARKTFEKRIDVKPADISVASPDEQFLYQVMEIIEKNISNPDFSVEELSRAAYMSRVALYKKLLALTGKTPIEFIRSVRLKRAAQLLEKSQMTVAEIAYEVGFNNPKYFSKYFKMEYHVLPSQWGPGNKE